MSEKSIVLFNSLLFNIFMYISLFNILLFESFMYIKLNLCHIYQIIEELSTFTKSNLYKNTRWEMWDYLQLRKKNPNNFCLEFGDSF